MKVLPLWQPWASLVAMGAKRVETRSWERQSLVGERIAIHAAKTTRELFRCSEEPFSEYLTDSLPFGAIVATAVLDRITPITENAAAELEERNPHEFAFGDYTPGRFAWVLRDVAAVVPPAAFKARQGISEIADELVGIGTTNAETCRDCGAPMEWVATAAGASMPLDPGDAPAGKGNVIVDDTFAGRVARVVRIGDGNRVAHFATCPERRR